MAKPFRSPNPWLTVGDAASGELAVPCSFGFRGPYLKWQMFFILSSLKGLVILILKRTQQKGIAFRWYNQLEKVVRGPSELQSIVYPWGKSLGSFLHNETRFSRPLCGMMHLFVLPFQYGHNATVSGALNKLSILMRTVTPVCYLYSVCVCNKWTLPARGPVIFKDEENGAWCEGIDWMWNHYTQRGKKLLSYLNTFFFPINTLWHLYVMWLKPNSMIYI